MRKMHLILGLAILFGLVTGCARTPEGATSSLKKTISFDITVAGQINPAKYYFIALDVDQNSLTGPIPAVAQPWGNGWATGALTHYVEYSISQPNQFGVYRVVPDTNLQAADYIGAPYEASVINGNTLHVTVDLSTLATNEIPLDKMQSVNVNIITTDKIIQDPNYSGTKAVDGLGVSGNDYLTIPLTSNRTFSNADLSGDSREISGDMTNPDPDLDITDWKIEVRAR